MRRGRHIHLVKRSAQAASAAIELYNKPHFESRDEIFCILLVQAWELLLKARILYENGNKLAYIQVFDRSKARGRRKTPKLNRAGNPMTIDIVKAMDTVRQYKDKNIDYVCIGNIMSVIEIRDNAIHFVNEDKELSVKICHVGQPSNQFSHRYTALVRHRS